MAKDKQPKVKYWLDKEKTIAWDKDGAIEKYMRDQDPLTFDIGKIVWSGNPLGGFHGDRLGEYSRKKRVESGQRQIKQIKALIHQQAQEARIEAVLKFHKMNLLQRGKYLAELSTNKGTHNE